MTDSLGVGAMAGVVSDMGPVCTSSRQQFQNIIQLAGRGKIAEESIGLMFVAMLRARPKDGDWNFQVVFEGLMATNDGIDWSKVVAALDQPEWALADPGAFSRLAKAFADVVKAPFPLPPLIGMRWKNPIAQLSVLKAATMDQSFSFAHASHRIDPVEGLVGASSPTGTPNGAWATPDLIDCLAHLFDWEGGRLQDAVQEVLEPAVKLCPEVLLVSTANTAGEWTALHMNLFHFLVPVYIGSHPSSRAVLSRLWAVRRDMMVNVMAALYSKDAASVSAIVEAVYSIGHVETFIEVAPAVMAMDVACTASRREYFDLESWLVGKVKQGQHNFIRMMIRFIAEKLKPESPIARSPLTPTVQLIINKVLSDHSRMFQPQDLLAIRRVQEMQQQARPQVPEPRTEQQWPEDINAEANEYFDQIFHGKLTVSDAAQMLGRFATSAVPRQRQIQQCMVASLLDEFSHFDEYPDRERQVVTQFCGALLNAGVLQGPDLSWCLEALVGCLSSSPPGAKMFVFATEALRMALSRFPTWPHLCTALSNVRGLEVNARDIHAAAVSALRAASARASAAAAPASAPAPASSAAPGPASQGDLAQAGSQGAAAGPASGPAAQAGPQLPTLEREMQAQMQGVKVPTTGEQEKVMFAFNNLDPDNVSSKAGDIWRIVSRGYEKWFSNYVVVKRAAQEQNFQALYVKLILQINGGSLLKDVLSASYHYARILLASELIVNQASERMLLKNLGSWLGQLTLARNRPVLHRELSLKECIYEAYQKGRLIAVVPFVHKVLEGARSSQIFRPPNPWTVAVLALLVEIYTTGGERLKLPIRFEVEMTLNDFSLKVADVTASTSLHNYPRLVDLNQDWVADRSKAAVPGTLPGATMPRSQGSQGQGQGYAMGGPAAGKAAPGGRGMSPAMDAAVARAVRQGVRLNAALQGVSESLQLSRLVPAVLHKALGTCSGFVERYSAVACGTVKDLVCKDFVFEPEEGLMRSAAHSMAQKLATSLMVINIRDVLKASIMQLLNEALKQNVPETSARERIAQVITADNLQLCIQLLEQMALERSVADMDSLLEPEFARRTQARRSGRRYLPEALPQAISRLPSSLRPRFLAHIPNNTYDEFKHLATESSALSDSPPGFSGSAQPAPDANPQAPPQAQGQAEREKTGPAQGQAQSQAQAQAQAQAQVQLPAPALQRLALWRNQLETLVAKEGSGAGPFRNLPDRSEIRQLALGLPQVLQLPGGGPGQEPALIVRHLLAVIVPMEATTPQAKLLIQALAAGLGAVIKAAGPQQAAARAPVTEWVNALEGSPRIHKDALVSIIGAGAVDLPHLDGVISRMISSGSRALPGVELAVLVLTNCILGESSAAVADFGLTIDLLLRVAQRHPQGSLLLQLVEQARARGGQGPQGQAGAAGGAPGQESGGPPQGEAQGQGQGMGTQREQMTALFDQWVRMLHARKGDDKAERVDGENVKFVSQVRAMGFLNGDENTERFLRVLTEVSVIHCLKSETPGTRQLSFVAVDALVKLIAMLVSKHGGGAPLLAKVLSVMASVLQRDAASRGGAFNARPYYRMCIGLIYELTPSNQSDASAFPMLAAMAAAFNALQPLRVPGFAFAWLELVSFRGFLPKLLLLPRNKGWPHLLRLLVALLRFLEPYLHQAQLTPPVRLLYRGTLRVFLVLLHDFPEFLAEYHYQLCNAIPTSCVQFRNLILSAFPRSMRLPDPLTPNLKVDTLPEMALTPQILPDPVQGLPPHIRGLLDEVLAAQGQQKLGQAVHALCEEVKRVTRAEGLAGFTTSHATSLLNAVAFGVCKGALELGKGAQQPLLMSVFLQMATEFESEDRYLLFNAVANHLRFPNSHTHYFSCVVLYIFLKSQQPIIKEQLTRVLLERLMVNRPHPWGLLVTFIELIKNPVYKFWEQDFTRSSEEIRRLFANVAQHMGGPARPQA